MKRKFHVRFGGGRELQGSFLPLWEYVKETWLPAGPGLDSPP
jgi:hypothetical protein